MEWCSHHENRCDEEKGDSIFPHSLTPLLSVHSVTWSVTLLTPTVVVSLPLISLSFCFSLFSFLFSFSPANPHLLPFPPPFPACHFNRHSLPPYLTLSLTLPFRVTQPLRQQHFPLTPHTLTTYHILHTTYTSLHTHIHSSPCASSPSLSLSPSPWLPSPRLPPCPCPCPCLLWMRTPRLTRVCVPSSPSISIASPIFGHLLCLSHHGETYILFLASPYPFLIRSCSLSSLHLAKPAILSSHMYPLHLHSSLCSCCT